MGSVVFSCKSGGPFLHDAPYECKNDFGRFDPGDHWIDDKCKSYVGGIVPPSGLPQWSTLLLPLPNVPFPTPELGSAGSVRPFRHAHRLPSTTATAESGQRQLSGGRRQRGQG